jgi:hypothetical protein
VVVREGDIVPEGGATPLAVTRGPSLP